MAITKVTNAVLSSGSTLSILDGKSFLDEDNMASNSATGIASQQSIKAYVDSQVTAQDLDFQGDSGGALSIDLDSESITIAGGTGLATVGSGNTITVNIDSTVTTLTGSQTLTNKSLTAPTLTGTAVVASLDISGDIDVDGTTNLDVVDIDGAVDMATTLTVAGNVDFNGNLDVDGVLETDNLTINGSQGTDGQVLTSTGSGVGWEAVAGGSPSITDYSNGSVKVFTIYQGGGLDVNVAPSFPQGAAFYSALFVNGYLRTTDIRTASNSNIEIDPNGSGVVIFKGNATKGAGQFKLNCENNSHGITIKGPPHSAGASYTLTLPNNDGNANQFLQTNGSGVLTWAAASGGSSTPSITDNGNANAITINSNEDVTFSEDAEFATNKEIRMGDNDQFTLYNNGYQTFLKTQNSINNDNICNVRSDTTKLQATNGQKTSATFQAASSVDLYHNNVKKFETTTSGIDITGTVNLDNLTIAGAQGTDGQVLTSTGSGIAWEDASGGGGGGGSTLSGGTSIYLHNSWSNQNIGRNTVTKLLFDTVLFGNSGTPFSTTNNNYTVPSAGKYLILGQINSANLVTTANGQQPLYLSIYKNGSEIFYDTIYNKSVSADTIQFKLAVNRVLDLAQNDVIDFRARFSNFASTTTLDIARSEDNTYLYIVKIES